MNGRLERDAIQLRRDVDALRETNRELQNRTNTPASVYYTRCGVPAVQWETERMKMQDRILQLNQTVCH